MHPWRYVIAALLLPAGACQPTVDRAAVTKALLEADRAWAALAEATAPVDSIVAYWSPDARVILPGQPIVVGTAALRNMVAGTRAIPGFHISWTPDSAVVSPGANFGYTYGTNRITAPDPTGPLHTMEGRYIAIWRKEPDGSWRCTVDISNEGPSSTQPPAPRS